MPTLLNIVHDVKVASTVAGGTAATSVFDIVQGGVSLFALSAGAVLSVILIVIHILKDRREKHDAKVRLGMEVKEREQRLEKLTLETKVLGLELRKLKSK